MTDCQVATQILQMTVIGRGSWALSPPIFSWYVLFDHFPPFKDFTAISTSSLRMRDLSSLMAWGPPGTVVSPLLSLLWRSDRSLNTSFSLVWHLELCFVLDEWDLTLVSSLNDSHLGVVTCQVVLMNAHCCLIWDSSLLLASWSQRLPSGVTPGYTAKSVRHSHLFKRSV